MNKKIEKSFEELGSTDYKIRMAALQHLLKITGSPVDWVYEVWDRLLEKLDHENSYQRSIAVMLLYNLAKSDLTSAQPKSTTTWFARIFFNPWYASVDLKEAVICCQKRGR